MTTQCRICGNQAGLVYYPVSEKMMGRGDTFEYFTCPACGCLQIGDFPGNLQDYYAGGYYSYAASRRLIESPLRKWGDSHRVKHALTGKDAIGWLFNHLAKPLEYLPWIRAAGISQEARILDVGCGQGRLLHRLALGGFTHLTGIDPFIEQDISYPNGVTVLKQDLQAHCDSGKQYDFIMLHHSLEHMPDQAEALQSAARLLAPGGVILVRIPLSDSYAWEHYRENWVQLDAPRHLYLHTRRSMALLAENAGLVVDSIVYDSAKFQFTGSELYIRSIPLSAPKRSRQIFSRTQLQEFERQAEQLNSEGRGDQAAFYLRKPLS